MSDKIDKIYDKLCDIHEDMGNIKSNQENQGEEIDRLRSLTVKNSSFISRFKGALGIFSSAGLIAGIKYIFFNDQ